MTDADEMLDEAFGRTVDLGNQLVGEDPETDAWDVADGILAGAIQFWLFSRQPCGNPACEDCAGVSTAELRLKALQAITEEFAKESEYFHTATDSNVGRA